MKKNAFEYIVCKITTIFDQVSMSYNAHICFNIDFINSKLLVREALCTVLWLVAFMKAAWEP